MSATIKIEFAAGTGIEKAFEEAIRLSKLLSVTTEFKFNNVTCWGDPDGTPEIGAINYHKAQSSDHTYKCATCWTNYK